MFHCRHYPRWKFHFEKPFVRVYFNLIGLLDVYQDFAHSAFHIFVVKVVVGCPPLQEIHFKMNLLAWNKILFNTEDALLREWVVIRTESDSSSEEDEIPQFSKGIAKQIDKMEQKLKKCVKTELVGEKKDSKSISSDGEEDEFDYDKWVKEQCEKIQEIEEEDLDEKTMQAIVEESDLSLVSMARPAIELRRFKCEVSAKLKQVPMRNKKTKRCDKNCLSQIFFRGALETRGGGGTPRKIG